MAITKIGTMSNPPGSNDWTTLMSLVQGFINKFNSRPSILSQNNDTSILPYIKQGTYISMGGTLYIVDTEDYIIQGSVISGKNYIYLTVSGDNLIATWTQNISSYTWNSVYGYYSYGANILLPYIIDYDGINYVNSQFDRNFNQKLKTTSDVNFNSVNGYTIDNNFVGFPDMTIPVVKSDGVTELGKILDFHDIGSTADYDYRITLEGNVLVFGGDVRFNSVNTGHGANELYPMNQNVTTSSAPIFAGLKLTGSLLPTNSPTYGSYTLGKASTWTPPRGIYIFNREPHEAIGLSIDGGTTYVAGIYLGTIFADGSNVVLRNTYTLGTFDVTYLKF